MRRTDYIHAMISWFDIEFTACHKPVKFSTGPHTKYTHWKQTVFYLKDVLTAQEGEEIQCNVKVKPNEKNRRDLDIDLAYNFQSSDNNRSAQALCDYRMS